MSLVKRSTANNLNVCLQLLLLLLRLNPLALLHPEELDCHLELHEREHKTTSFCFIFSESLFEVFLARWVVDVVEQMPLNHKYSFSQVEYEKVRKNPL
jgi:hypothetical protein